MSGYIYIRCLFKINNNSTEASKQKTQNLFVKPDILFVKTS